MKHKNAASIRVRGYFAAVSLLAAAMLLPAPSAFAAETESAIARGGRLYDKWFAENKATKPAADHPAYPHKGGKYGKDVSWRCKECHGWDYAGKDGAYAKGGHATGIKGIAGAAGKDPAAITAVMKDKNHGYTDAMLSAKDMSDLALFVSKGQVDFAKYIDAATKKPKGNGAKGEVYFNTLCAGCHGVDGKKVKDAPPLGSVADNPWEMLHKVLNGQAGEAMPAMRALDIQISVDIITHLQTLPAK
jgi:Cytochrome C oxidase, cbb3-type, subunit III